MTSPAPYYRAVDPFPLQSEEQNQLHPFYRALAEDRLITTRCARCHREDWPPRAFCPACRSDEYEWTELPREGVVLAFTVQEAGLPAGLEGPRVFAMVKVGVHRIFARLVETNVDELELGRLVELAPYRVDDDSYGDARYLPGFRLKSS